MNTNTRLKIALNKAKEANVPNDNIERTIKKASGDLDGVQYEEIIYEGYGPAGVAVLVEVLTDNRNRSAADIRHIFNKNGGNLGESGCVSFLFERKGVFILETEQVKLSEEELMLEVLEAGAEDFIMEDGQYEIVTVPAEFEQMKAFLEQKEITIQSAEITMLPSTTVALHGDQALQMMKLLDALEDHDDVQNAYANVELDEDELNALTD